MSVLIPCLKEILEKGTFNDKIYLQIIDFKNISKHEIEKHRAIVSDGVNWTSAAMFSSELNEKIRSDEFIKYSIISVELFQIYGVINGNANGELKTLIIKDFEIVSSNENDVIGDPEILEMVLSKSEDKNSKDSSSNSADKVIIISELNPNLDDWTIKVRVIKKRIMKNWNNNKGSGKFFSFDVMDQSSSMSVTAFNDLADKFYETIEIDKAYTISKGQVKETNKLYNIDSHDFEVIISKDTTISALSNDSDVPYPIYNIISISEISELNEGETVDVIGVVWRINEIEYIYSANKPLRKRDIVLFDDSGSAKVTLWNEDADVFDYELQTVLLIQKGRICQYEGMKYIGITRSSIIRGNPPMHGNKFFNSFISK